MAIVDIILDKDTQELVALNGDFKTGDMSNSYIKYICLAGPGHYKTSPTMGADLYTFINANASPAQIERVIRLNLESDIFKRPSIDTSNFPTIAIDKVELDV